MNENQQNKNSEKEANLRESVEDLKRVQKIHAVLHPLLGGDPNERARAFKILNVVREAL